MKRIILLGGGLDSTTLLVDYAQRKDSTKELEGLHINYGQKAYKGEVSACRYFCKKYDISLKEIQLDLTGINQSMIMNGQNINKPEKQGIREAQRRNCFEMRNGILYMVAVSYAATTGAREVLVGLHIERQENGHYIFPDATNMFAQKINKIIDGGLTKKVKGIRINAPYHILERYQILQLAEKLDKEILTKSFTCYESLDENKECGECVHCIQKKENLKLARIGGET